MASLCSLRYAAPTALSIEPFTLWRSPPAFGGRLRHPCFQNFRETLTSGHCALPYAYPKRQQTRNCSTVPPLMVRKCCVLNSPRLRSARPSLYRSSRALLSVGILGLRRNPCHLAGALVSILLSIPRIVALRFFPAIPMKTQRSIF